MKALLRRLAGTDRPRVIAVIGMTLEEVRSGVEHARTSASGLPVWAFSGEPLRRGEQTEIEGCERLVAGASAAQVRRDLRTVWPALCIVAWTGGKGAALKLLPFTVPPYRIVIANEAQGFFAARPGALAAHVSRRGRDGALSGARRVADWSRGGAGWMRSSLLQSSDRLWSVWLAGLGVAAKGSPPLTRFALRRRRGQPAGTMPAPQATESSFVEIAIPGRAWQRQAVLDAARDASVQFLVFRRAGDTGDPAPMIALARQTGAFAVGRQMAYAGWRKTILSRHPFRVLQPEEITEAMAPWSPLLVLRRDLVLRFGVPRAWTFGGALGLLYWQAAAAGIPSLLMGASAAEARSITQEPAMELEDAEFALRLLGSPRLRALAPAFPARTRGNRACAPALARGYRAGLTRVLVVSPYLPFPLAHGGAVRIYNLCRALSDRVDFVLACFREAGEVVQYEPLLQVFRQVHVIDIDEKASDASAPRQVVEYRNSAMTDLIHGLCEAREVDLVQLEYTQMAEYAAHTAGVPVLLVEHDLTFTLHEQLSKALGTAQARQQYERWLEFERTALRGASAVWTMSDRDRELAIENGAPAHGTAVVPNGVDLQRYQPVRRQTQEASVLFVGSFRHLPNLLAFEALRLQIMPLVWNALPNVRLHVIAGLHHERAAEAAKKAALLAPDARIRVQGFVEDVRPAYRECDVAVIPLPVSAGTNIKLMEAMACGRAAISTEVGCQGLNLRDETDLLVREAGAAFAAAIVELLRDEPRRLRIAAAARRTAEARFGWNAIAAVASESYATLQGRSEQNLAG